MKDQVFTLRWGILGAGSISEKFVRDLLADPGDSQVRDVRHQVAAVGSRSRSRAQEFLERIGKTNPNLKDTKTHGSYQNLVADPDVDVIHIGTPHNFHYSHTKLCLDFKKHVLCEKPLTVNAEQAESLAALARKNKCFLMEAMWTRFLPITVALQKVLASEEIGEVERVEADMGDGVQVNSLPPEHRLVNPDLAGGALLDLGPYAWTMISVGLFHQGSREILDKCPELDFDNLVSNLPIPEIVASSHLYCHPMAHNKSPVDGSTIAILKFRTSLGRISQGVLIASIFQGTNEERAVTFYGSKGRLRIESPAYCPKKFVVTKFGDPSNGKVLEESIYKFDLPGNTNGYICEADEVARCIRDGKLESDKMPIRESILMLKVFDEIRKQIGVVFPDALESVEC